MSRVDQLAYRDRLELGFLTPADVDRFRTSPEEQRALTADHQTISAVVNSLQDSSKGSALLLASREGDVGKVRQLLDDGVAVDSRGGPLPPIAAAALRGHTQIVQLLIRHGANVNLIGENEQTALMNAVKLNHIETARLLLRAGANFNLKDRVGDNVLAVAVHKNYLDMLAMLLKQGVPPDLPDNNGLTALYWAKHLDRPASAELLILAGAQVQRMKTEFVVIQPYSMGDF